ncbi:Putative syntaxin-24 [Apostasia shenzhenica]|uniref:Syntaxin-24 n=1 Tax=Apostasia shenzhenica TaxID=1088818 RepID=A0A2I0A828_9ASPA|nr:Putative syntaxin-24 [Apostasia shenzhenica]
MNPSSPPPLPPSTMAADAEAKEHQLNVPYYGPPIVPPPTDGRMPQQTPATRRSGGAYYVLCLLFRIITALIIAVGIVVLILWLVYNPESPKVFAESASLSRFALSGAGNGTLAYNLTVALSFRNPNKKYSFYYKSVVAEAFYDGYQIGRTTFHRLHQGRKSTMPLGMKFEGETPAIAGDSGLQGVYNREKGGGFFYVSLKIYATIRLKMIVVESVKFRPEVDCYLRIPAPANATSLAAGFARTECDVNGFS